MIVVAMAHAGSLQVVHSALGKLKLIARLNLAKISTSDVDTNVPNFYDRENLVRFQF